MKKNLLTNFLSLILLLGLGYNAQAQREVIIEGYPISGGVDINDFVDAIGNALDADEPNRVTDPDVTYILKRDHLYPNTKTIKNTFSLRMIADEGTGALPVILTWESLEGNYDQLLEAKADVYCENIQFDNLTPIGVPKGRNQRLIANGVRGEFKGCIIYYDDGAAFSIYADDCKIFISDCFVQSIGSEGANDSNGRFLDIRAENTVDSVVIQNCTANHLNGAFFSIAKGAIVNYLKIDHNTCFNNRDAGINAYRTKKVVITNNLFMNSQILGDIPSIRDTLITDPDLFHSVCINFDSIWDASNIVIRNNNIFYTEEIKNLWAKYDTIFEPLRVSPKAMRALGADSVNAAFSEVVTLGNICDAPTEYIEAIFLDRSATVFPSQLCVGTAGGLFPEDVDASYETSSVSYTAADGGLPLGDLNWFPEKKAIWLENPNVSVKIIGDKNISVYPNPAQDNIYFSTGKVMDVRVDLVNILGKNISSLESNDGNIEMNVSALENGLYIYRISDSNKNVIKAGKILISK